MCGEICSGAQGPERIHRSLVDQLGIMFAQLFRKFGGCRLPINIGPAIVPHLFADRGVLTDSQNFSTNTWALESTDAACKQYFEVVSRNVSRARV